MSCPSQNCSGCPSCQELVGCHVELQSSQIAPIVYVHGLDANGCWKFTPATAEDVYLGCDGLPIVAGQRIARCTEVDSKITASINALRLTDCLGASLPLSTPVVSCANLTASLSGLRLIDCAGVSQPLTTPIATCMDLQNAVSDLRLVNCNGNSIPLSTPVATCTEVSTAITSAINALRLTNCAGTQMPLSTPVPSCTEMNTAIGTAISALRLTNCAGALVPLNTPVPTCVEMNGAISSAVNDLRLFDCTGTALPLTTQIVKCTDFNTFWINAYIALLCDIQTYTPTPAFNVTPVSFLGIGSDGCLAKFEGMFKDCAGADIFPSTRIASCADLTASVAGLRLTNCAGVQVPLSTPVPTCVEMNTAIATGIGTAIGALSLINCMGSPVPLATPVVTCTEFAAQWLNAWGSQTCNVFGAFTNTNGIETFLGFDSANCLTKSGIFANAPFTGNGTQSNPFGLDLSLLTPANVCALSSAVGTTTLDDTLVTLDATGCISKRVVRDAVACEPIVTVLAKTAGGDLVRKAWSDLSTDGQFTALSTYGTTPSGSASRAWTADEEETSSIATMVVTNPHACRDMVLELWYTHRITAGIERIETPKASSFRGKSKLEIDAGGGTFIDVSGLASVGSGTIYAQAVPLDAFSVSDPNTASNGMESSMFFGLSLPAGATVTLRSRVIAVALDADPNAQFGAATQILVRGKYV